MFIYAYAGFAMKRSPLIPTFALSIIAQGSRPGHALARKVGSHTWVNVTDPSTTPCRPPGSGSANVSLREISFARDESSPPPLRAPYRIGEDCLRRASGVLLIAAARGLCYHGFVAAFGDRRTMLWNRQASLQGKRDIGTAVGEGRPLALNSPSSPVLLCTVIRGITYVDGRDTLSQAGVHLC